MLRSGSDAINIGMNDHKFRVASRGGQSSRKIYLSRSIVTYSKMPFK